MSAELKEAGPQYLFFESCGQRFALEIRYIEEIVFPRPVVPATMAPGFLEGVINLRGKVTTVFSLKEIMGLEGEAEPPSAMVVLQLTGTALAFGVGEILGIQNLSTGLLEEMTVVEKTGVSPVKAVFQYGGYPVSLLDMERLVSFLFGFDYKAKNKI